MNSSKFLVSFLGGGVAVVVDLQFPGLPPAGSDEDDAVGGPGPVDGLARRILKDLDGGDVFGGHVIDVVVGYAVDDDQRVVTHQGDLAADDDIGAPPRAGVGQVDLHAGGPAPEHLTDVRRGDGRSIGDVHAGDGPHYVALLYRPVAHDDDLVEQVGVLPEFDVHRALRYRDFQGGIAQVGDDQRGYAVRYRQGEIAFNVGHGARRRAFS